MSFNDTLRTDTPAGSDDPSEGDDRIREAKSALIERLDVDHFFGPSGTHTYDDEQTGKHRQVTFHSPQDLTSAPEDQGILFTKKLPDEGEIPELHWVNQNGQVVRLTRAALIHLTSEALLGILANDTFFTALDQEGTGTVNLIKAGRDENDESDVAVLPQGVRFPAASDLAQKTQLVHKKYVDDALNRYVRVTDQKFNANGGSYYQRDTWQSRDLNTKESDVFNLCTLEANNVQITLEAGTYYAHIVTPVILRAPENYWCVGTACLYNGTSEVTLLRAPNTSVLNTGLRDNQYFGVNHIVTGLFTVASGQKLDVRVISSYEHATYGLGHRYWEDPTTPNIYTVAEFWKLPETD